MEKPKFSRYIGIDYSGSKTPTTCLDGLRVYMTEGKKKLEEEIRESWTRKGVAEWIVKKLSKKELSKDVPTLVGIDHAFSFPLSYFERYANDGLKRTWPSFLKDFQNHWPTDKYSVECVRKSEVRNGAAREGDSGWLRLTEKRARGAKSVFFVHRAGTSGLCDPCRYSLATRYAPAVRAARPFLAL